MINCDADRLWVVSLKRKLSHSPLTYLVLVDQEAVYMRFLIIADVSQREKLEEVFEANEEAPVFLILAVDLLASLQRPFLRLVSPIARPLFHSVRISHFEEPFRATVIQSYCLG